MKTRTKILSGVTLLLIGAVLWTHLYQPSPLSKKDALEMASQRFSSFCAEQTKFRCDGVSVANAQYTSGKWLVEYESTDAPKKFLAFIVHADGGIEVTSFIDDAGDETSSEYQDQATIIIQNQTDELIASAKVTAFGSDHPAGKIGPDAAAQIKFEIDGEGGYVVVVEFASGRKLQSEEMGYLTSGMSSKDVIIVQRDKIFFDERNSE